MGRKNVSQVFFNTPYIRDTVPSVGMHLYASQDYMHLGTVFQDVFGEYAMEKNEPLDFSCLQ